MLCCSDFVKEEARVAGVYDCLEVVYSVEITRGGGPFMYLGCTGNRRPMMNTAGTTARCSLMEIPVCPWDVMRVRGLRLLVKKVANHNDGYADESKVAQGSVNRPYWNQKCLKQH